MKLSAFATAAIAVAAAVVLSVTAAVAQDTLAKIKEKGVLVVGVKNDYKPWGFLDPSGKIVGLEIDLAEDLAKRLGVKLEMLPVIAANRMEFLRQGRNYYAGATNVLAPKSAHLKTWQDLKGRKVCAVQGAYYNRRVSQLYAPELVVFPAVPDALNALVNGNCIAFLFDDTLIGSTLAGGDPKWAGYEMPLISEDPQLWAIGARLEDLDAPFGKLIKEISVEWHKSGRLLELEKKWGIKASPYLLETHDKLKGS